MREHKRQMDRRKLGRRPRLPRISWWVVGAVGAVLTVVALVWVGNLGRGGGGVNGTPSGPQQVGTVKASATRINLGRVPLNRWMNPTFRLRNLGVAPVAITIPNQGVETLQGC